MLSGLFGVAEGITDAQIDTIDRNLDGLVLQEVFSAAVGFHFDASFVGKASHAAYADGQFVVQERFGEIGGQDVESAAPALKGIGFGGGDEEGAGFQVPRQCLLYTEHGVGLPSAVVSIQFFAAKVVVTGSTIEEDAGIFRGQPVDVDIHARLVSLHDVSIRGVEQSFVIETVLFDGVAGIGVPEVGVEHQFL